MFVCVCFFSDLRSVWCDLVEFHLLFCGFLWWVFCLILLLLLLLLYPSQKALDSLERLHLDMYLRDKDLGVICDHLKRCAGNLRELQLRGLEHGKAGFSSLVELLKRNRNLHTLCLSMNKEKLMYGTCGFMTPSALHAERVHMPRHAYKKSKDAFRQQVRSSCYWFMCWFICYCP